MAIATPSIPGSAVSAFTLMASGFGIPLEAVSIVISLGFISDRISTPTQVNSCQLELIQIADKLNAIDKSVLRSKANYQEK